MTPFQMYSPNMLKTYAQCPRKFDFQYVKNISMPINDEIFEFGKNIHALASYYLKGENIDKMEKSLSKIESETWEYLKSTKYFTYNVLGIEKQIFVKIGEHFLGGRIDAIVKNNGNIYILDYKTGGAPKNAKYDFQTMVYVLAVKEFFKPENLTFIYLDLKNKKEELIEYTIDLGIEYKKKLTDTITNIENNLTARKKEGCKCEYSLICH